MVENLSMFKTPQHTHKHTHTHKRAKVASTLHFSFSCLRDFVGAGVRKITL